MTANSETQDESSTNNPSSNAHHDEDHVVAAHQMVTNPSNPYYMHDGDNTGMQITSVMLFDENYST